ncbi:hypothetical protein [Oryzomonas rubra]|uniref:hypothetical protein n=1 Tax=Oryzomonas rubra TaxID=2509454 RepID=UPI001FEB6324|nr:hypothetical protein [Oryzomonas rubra]
MSFPESDVRRLRTDLRPRERYRPLPAPGRSRYRLVESGARQIRLLTDTPEKMVGLQGRGLEIVERVPLEIPSAGIRIRYMRTKRENWATCWQTCKTRTWYGSSK